MHILLIGLVATVALGVYYWRKRFGAAETFAPATRETDWYKKLLRKTMGDRAHAERLIAYERERQPRAARAQLICAAVERWERDAR